MSELPAFCFPRNRRCKVIQPFFIQVFEDPSLARVALVGIVLMEPDNWPFYAFKQVSIHKTLLKEASFIVTTFFFLLKCFFDPSWVIL